MIELKVPDMSCNHCVGAVTQAVKQADPAARVEVNLDTHRVKVETQALDAAAVAHAIEEAGYSPESAGA